MWFFFTNFNIFSQCCKDIQLLLLLLKKKLAVLRSISQPRSTGTACSGVWLRVTRCAWSCFPFGAAFYPNGSRGGPRAWASNVRAMAAFAVQTLAAGVGCPAPARVRSRASSSAAAAPLSPDRESLDLLWKRRPSSALAAYGFGLLRGPLEMADASLPCSHWGAASPLCQDDCSKLDP